VIGVEAGGVGRSHELQPFIILLGEWPVVGAVDVIEKAELQDILREMRTVAEPVCL
jgi:hypothetical protein